MSKDIRKLFEEVHVPDEPKIKSGHEKRFLERLEKELPEQRKNYGRRIAMVASIIVLLGASVWYFSDHQNIIENKRVVNKVEKPGKPQNISLGDLSPDLNKLENYYVANINLELSELEVSEKNKKVVHSFMGQLNELNIEYSELNRELNDMGPNDQTITAMIKNLQLRLQLMRRLKEKINQLKTSKNEAVTKTNV
ncbi:hypothetical protein B0O79_0661 [Flavobacteriaceae bacterium MAR_2009_75]|nr:hypothetical protein B0O79_0661 [Flavobacteriaceae bacterium MAR_2009_75]